MKNHFYFVNDLEENYVNQSCSVFHGYGEVKQVDSDVVVISAHSPQLTVHRTPAVRVRLLRLKSFIQVDLLLMLLITLSRQDSLVALLLITETTLVRPVQQNLTLGL